MRQEHGVGSGSNGLVGIALHQTDLLQTLRHQTAHGKVNIHIFHTGFCHIEHVVVARLHDLVDLQLALGELA